MQIEMIEGAIEMLENTKKEQNEIIEKGKEYCQKELLDYHHSKVIEETEKQKKQKLRIENGIKRNLNR